TRRAGRVQKPGVARRSSTVIPGHAIARIWIIQPDRAFVPIARSKTLHPVDVDGIRAAGRRRVLDLEYRAASVDVVVSTGVIRTVAGADVRFVDHPGVVVGELELGGKRKVAAALVGIAKRPAIGRREARASQALIHPGATVDPDGRVGVEHADVVAVWPAA